MDKTSEYILQCEKAEEIQATKHKGSNYHLYLEYGDYAYWNGQTVICSKDYDLMLSTYDRIIWLPHQDDLQEIYLQWVNRRELRQTAPMALQFFATFVHNETRTIKSSKITSLEQLWLAFVMKECFNKVWSIEGEEWIIGKN